MKPICPICYQGLVTTRARAFGTAGNILPYPATIHWCPTAQPDPANDVLAGDPVPEQPKKAPVSAPVFSLVTP